MFKNIILATDGSKHASKAADVAIDMAAHYKAKLTLVTVLSAAMTLSEIESMPQSKTFPKDVKKDMRNFRKAVQDPEEDSIFFAGYMIPTMPGAVAPMPLGSLVPAPFSAIAALGDAILDAVAVKAKKKGVKSVEYVSVTGHPADAIVTAAKKAKADLLVLGTRGLSDLKGIVVGSVSHQVMHLATCPCLTVK